MAIYKRTAAGILVFVMLLTGCTGKNGESEAYNPASTAGHSAPVQSEIPQEDILPTDRFDLTSFVMDTIILQQAYGPNAEEAMAEVVRRLNTFERQFSLFDADSEIGLINAAAGGEPVEVSEYTFDLLKRSVALSLQSDTSFAVTIGPLTLAWGVTGNTPRIVPQDEIDELLKLVDDSLVEFYEETGTNGETVYRVRLPLEGMAIDLGGIAKGEACSMAEDVYREYGLESALISLGGNIYTFGLKPDGSAFRVGYRMPEAGASSYIGSFEMTDLVIAVSGGYERFFTAGDKEYGHIIDPRSGEPAESDILSIGVVHEDGATSDFYSTMLFVLGKQRALEYMENGITCILLDYDGMLYVSESLEETFTLYEATADQYTVVFVPGS